jgi:OOP family OmpA-OmpF porin
MNKRIYFIILLLTCRICNAQNLVQNGDFEQYTSCPTNFAQIDSVLNWKNPQSFPIGGGGSPDYFNSCTTNWSIDIPGNSWGYQYAHSGQGYAGLNLIFYGIPDFREYIETQFTTSFVANQCYHLQMFISQPNYSEYATDALGIYFSNTLVSGINNHDTLPFIPQITNPAGNYFTDTLNWIPFTANYTATGGEKYMIIGNFKGDANTSTILINGGTSQANGYIFIDDVSLTLCTTGIEEQTTHAEIKTYPNPVADGLNIAINNNELSEIILYDVASRILLQQRFTNTVTLNTKQLAKGIYLYEVRNKKDVIKKGKVVKD